uniref:Uncharacterized protein n=1 Tax=Arundo donax TaxID=35708 RepID=A0A0A9FWW1_ARUDO
MPPLYTDPHNKSRGIK